MENNSHNSNGFNNINYSKDLYSPTIDLKLEMKKNKDLIKMPEENFLVANNNNDNNDNYKINKNFKANGDIDSKNSNVENSEKLEIIFTSEYLRNEFKFKIVQKTYDYEIIEWLFNVKQFSIINKGNKTYFNWKFTIILK